MLVDLEMAAELGDDAIFGALAAELDGALEAESEENTVGGVVWER